MAENDSSEIVKEAAEAVAFNDVKAVGEAGAILQNLAVSNAVHQQQIDWQDAAAQRQAGQTLSNILLGKMGENIIATNPGEAAGGIAMAGLLTQILRTTGVNVTPPT